ILGVATSLNPFSFRDSYRALDKLRAADRLARLRDPEVRRRILAEAPSERELARMGQFIRFVATCWDRMFVMGDPPDYEPTEDKSIAAIGARDGRAPDAVAYDYLTGGADHFLFFPVVGYVHGDHEQIRELLLDPATLRPWSPARRSSSMERRPARDPAGWCAPGVKASLGRRSARLAEELPRQDSGLVQQQRAVLDRGLDLAALVPLVPRGDQHVV